MRKTGLRDLKKNSEDQNDFTYKTDQQNLGKSVYIRHIGKSYVITRKKPIDSFQKNSTLKVATRQGNENKNRYF